MELKENGNELISIKLSNLDEMTKVIKSNKRKILLLLIGIVLFFLPVIKCFITVLTCDYVYAEYSKEYNGYYYRFSDNSVIEKYGTTGMFKSYNGLPVYVVSQDTYNKKEDKVSPNEYKCYALYDNKYYNLFPVKFYRIKLYYKENECDMKPMEGLYESVAVEVILLIFLHILTIKNNSLKMEMTQYEREE
ncbi:MAG: hypothetical protein ACI4E1_01225 [Lachnospira sp.]